ncbi:MAG: MASE1 domain-containing protein [Vicinamibacterales bacterium]
MDHVSIMPKPAADRAIAGTRIAGSTRTALASVQNAALLAITYFAIAGLGYSLSPADDLGGFFRLPAGLVVATFLLTSRSQWLGLIAGAFLGAAAFGLTHDLAPETIAARAAITILQAVIATELLERLCGRPFALRNLRDVATFLLAAVTGATLVGALIGVALAGHAPGGFTHSVIERWSSAALGVLTLTPLLLQWADLPEDKSGRVRLRNPVEASLLVFATACVVAFVFGHSATVFAPVGLLLIVPVVWAAARFGLHGVTAVVMAESLPMAFATALATATAGDATSTSSAAAAQLFAACVAAAGLVLAVAMHPRAAR